MISEKFASYAVTERKSSTCPEVIHAAKRCFIDWLSTTTAGGIKMPAVGFQKAFAEEMDRGMSRLIPTGRKATMRAATLINAAASHTIEFDDVFGPAAYHPGTPTVSTAFSVADNLGANGLTFLHSIIIGYEISTRIAEAMGRSHYKFWHTQRPTVLTDPFSVREPIKMDKEQFINGLGRWYNGTVCSKHFARIVMASRCMVPMRRVSD